MDMGSTFMRQAAKGLVGNVWMIVRGLMLIYEWQAIPD